MSAEPDTGPGPLALHRQKTVNQGPLVAPLQLPLYLGVVQCTMYRKILVQLWRVDYLWHM